MLIRFEAIPVYRRCCVRACVGVPYANHVCIFRCQHFDFVDTHSICVRAAAMITNWYGIWQTAVFSQLKNITMKLCLSRIEREKKSQLSSISFVSIGNSFIHLFFYCYNYFERVINTPEKRQKPETDILPLTARRKRVSEWASDQKNQTLLMNEFYNLQCGLWNVVDKLTVRCRKMYFISFDVECCPAFSSNSKKSNSDWHNWTIFFMRKLSVVHHWAN